MNFPKIRKHIFRQLIDIAIVLALSSLITYAFVGNYLFSNFHTVYKNTLFGFCIGYSLWKGNQFIGWLGSSFFPWVKNPKLTFTINSALSVVFTVLDIIAVYYFYLKFVFNTNIFENFNHWGWQMAFTFLISLVITTSFYLVYFFKWWRIATVNGEKLKQEAIQLRYDALKSQVNPHFMFNSLSVLSSLIDTDTVKAKQFIQQFSDIYRYVLDQKDKELVPLEDELKFVQSYINLHQMRHGDNLNVIIDINNYSGYIIPLSLQTLLENCFKHNVVSDEKPLTVRIWRENEFIIVQNNLQKRRTIQESNGIGLETISKRYKYLSNQAMEVIESNDHFTVKVPIIKSIL
ncbi:MAG TPA: histidine kinase [Tenuifilaceae bacterium]|nr:histidine kinase [Tenuifilaceae bacterium]